MSRSPGFGFFLFILINGFLFVRPVDLIPSLAGAPIHKVLMLCCLGISAGATLGQLKPSSVITNPIHASILCFFVSRVLSLLSNFMIREAIYAGVGFIDVLLFYFLLVALLDSLSRLRVFLIWLCFFVVILAGLAMLHYYEVINIPALDAVKQGQDQVDEETGQRIVVTRLQSVGFYNNPNDLSRILVTGILIALYFLGDRRLGMLRPLWLLPIALLGQGLHLTHSRGGLLSLFAGIGALFYNRYGRTKTILLIAIILPIMLVGFHGRQTNFTTSEGTAQDRIKLWNDGFVLMQGSPIFGIGVDEYDKNVGLTAHNSFVLCYVELGFIGGTFFVAMFYLPFRVLWSKSPDQATGLDIELMRLRPFILAILVATVVGMWSSTRSYSVTTYVIVGICAAYLRVLSDQGHAVLPRFDLNLVRRLAIASALTLIAFYLYVRLAARY